MSAAENLRKFGFSGSIDVFTKGSAPLIKRQNLTKIINEEGNENLLYNRNRKYWEDLDINVHYNQEVLTVENDNL